METAVLGQFLRDDAARLITVVGRAGIGKTAMACRLLKSLETGKLPDDGGALKVEGIVYLSATGGRRIDLPNLFADLCRLLPEARAERLDSLYEDPHVATETKVQALLKEFPGGPTVVLLDNFEDLVDSEGEAITDAELDEALRALLGAPQHGVKVILTTRVAPKDLNLLQTGRQRNIRALQTPSKFPLRQQYPYEGEG